MEIVSYQLCTICVFVHSKFLLLTNNGISLFNFLFIPNRQSNYGLTITHIVNLANCLPALKVHNVYESILCYYLPFTLVVKFTYVQVHYDVYCFKILFSDTASVDNLQYVTKNRALYDEVTK